MINILLHNENYFKENWELISSFILELDQSFEEFVNLPKKNQYMPWIQLYLVSRIHKYAEEMIKGESLFIYRYISLYLKKQVQENPAHFYEDPIVIELQNMNIKNIVTDLMYISEDKLDAFISAFDMQNHYQQVHEQYALKMKQSLPITIIELIGMLTFYHDDGKSHLNEEIVVYLLKQAIKLKIPSFLFSEEMRLCLLGTICKEQCIKREIFYDIVFVTCSCPKGKRGEIDYRKRKIYLYARNIKGLNVSAPIEESLETLSVFFHEISHYEIDTNLYQDCNSSINLIHCKEEILSEFLYNQKEKNFIKNYGSLHMEWEAEKRGTLLYQQFLGTHFPSLFQEMQSSFEEKLCYIAEKQKNKERFYKQKSIKLDCLFEQVCQNKQLLIEKYPDLNLEYKKDGKRKHTCDILLEIKVLKTENKDEKRIINLEKIVFERDLSLEEWFFDIFNLIKESKNNQEIQRIIQPLIEKFYAVKIVEMQSEAYFNKEMVSFKKNMEKGYHELVEALSLYSYQERLTNIEILMITSYLIKIRECLGGLKQNISPKVKINKCIL